MATFWKIATDKSKAKPFPIFRDASALAKAYDAEHPNHMAIVYLGDEKDQGNPWLVEIVEEQTMKTIGWLT